MGVITKILETSGSVEVVMRYIASAFSPIKRSIKHMLHDGRKTSDTISENSALVTKLRSVLSNCGIENGDIVIIHSSLDGLKALGLSGEKIIELVLDVYASCTVVFTTFPIASKRKKEVYSYDPEKSLCGTGILPNLFLKVPGIVRSSFPYNSLAAIGEHAKEMMANDMNSIQPHDKYSAWEFCRQRHAKILFLGTTSREANTMAIHMIPDIMGECWPIDNWYECRKYTIKENGNSYSREIQIQSGFWYRYVNEYKTDKLLKDRGYLRSIGFDGIPLEIVDDSKEMSEFLVECCCQGKLMYTIPKKYYKTRNNL